MKYVFFGTPHFAAGILKRLIAANIPPSVVITNPDRPTGRKEILTPPAVKIEALEHDIPVEQPESLENLELKVKGLKLEFGVLAAYGKIVSKTIIDLFPKGIVVVHPSLLPLYRGATPIQSVILAGDIQTGTTLFCMDEKVDHGPILAQRKLQIINNESRIDLEKRLAELSADLLIETLPKFMRGEIKPTPQNHAGATYTKKIITEDGRVDLRRDSPQSIAQKVKALNPEPGVFTEENGTRIKILEADLEEGDLKIKKIQAAGKSPRTITEKETKELFGL